MEPMDTVSKEQETSMDRHIIPAEGEIQEIPPMLWAPRLRASARAVLDRPSAGNRLTLVLALVVAMGLGFAIPVMLDCVLLVAAILGGKIALWLEILHGVLFWGSLLFVTLPILCGVYRLAVLMTKNAEQGQEIAPTPNMKVSLGECLYPFTSAKAYLRTLYVGLQALVSAALVIGVPVGIGMLSTLWMPLLKEELAPALYVLVWLLHAAVILGSGIGFLCLVSRRAGMSYGVFAYPDVAVRELNRHFISCRRSVSLVLWLTVGFAGWILLSLVAVFIPFLVHTIPYMMLTAAAYGQFLDLRNVVTEREPMNVGKEERV